MLQLRDPNLIPPSKRNLLPWEPVTTLLGKTFKAAPSRNHWFSSLYRVLVDGVEYYADDVELDMLWEGKTPESLGLETTEIVP